MHDWPSEEHRQHLWQWTVYRPRLVDTLGSPCLPCHASWPSEKEYEGDLGVGIQRWTEKVLVSPPGTLLDLHFGEKMS